MPPSPFLLGLALLFWGWMTDRIWIGVALALLIEASRYSRIRWTFTELAFVRAWRLSVLMMVITLALVLMDRVDPRAMSRVFSWLPLILLPLQFVQSYGTSPVTGLGTFALMIRRRRAHAEKFGLPFKEIHFSFSKVYLAAILISSSLGVNSWQSAFFPLMVGLIGWALLSTRKFSWGYLPVVLCLSLLPAGLAAFAGQKGLMALYSRLINPGFGSSTASDRVRETSMGDLGPLKQSQEILWRLKPVKGLLPRLIRLSSYQSYSSAGRWEYNDLPPDSKNLNADFKALPEIPNPENPTDAQDKFLLCFTDGRNPEWVKPSLPRYHLVGSFPIKSLVPLPGGATSFHGLGLYTDLDINSMGAVRLDSVEAIVDTDVLWSDALTPERPPWQRTKKYRQGKSVWEKLTWPDLDIPIEERKAVAEVAAQLRLSEGTTAQKIEKLREYFGTFQYRRYNDMPLKVQEGTTLIETFLTKNHVGHCEFFATATTLLLRQAGVPARYASGFAVIEFDPDRKEAIVRGVHAHAWARAWDEAGKEWVDVDTTPQDWTRKEVPPTRRFQGLLDWSQIQRENLLIWRSKPGRLALVTECILTPVAIGFLFIARNLWRSRQKVATADAVRRGATILSTPLSELEKPARRVLGRRPEGRPLSAWLRELAQLLEKPELLDEALALHQRMRFDPDAVPEDLRTRLAGLTAELKRVVKRLPKRTPPSQPPRPIQKSDRTAG
jgi:hypothetical protein